jgi:hypothetical protein
MKLVEFTGTAKSNIQIEAAITALLVVGTKPIDNSAKITLKNQRGEHMIPNVGLKDAIECVSDNEVIENFSAGCTAIINFGRAQNFSGDNQGILDLKGLQNADWKIFGIRGVATSDSFFKIVKANTVNSREFMTADIDIIGIPDACESVSVNTPNGIIEYSKDEIKAMNRLSGRQYATEIIVGEKLATTLDGFSIFLLPVQGSLSYTIHGSCDHYQISL